MSEDSEKSRGETGGKYYQDILCICKKLSEGGLSAGVPPADIAGEVSGIFRRDS